MPGAKPRLLLLRLKNNQHSFGLFFMQIAIWIIVILIIAALIKYLLGESGKK
jgi:uncharacterized membrane protein